MLYKKKVRIPSKGDLFQQQGIRSIFLGYKVWSSIEYPVPQKDTTRRVGSLYLFGVRSVSGTPCEYRIRFFGIRVSLACIPSKGYLYQHFSFLRKKTKLKIKRKGYEGILSTIQNICLFFLLCTDSKKDTERFVPTGKKIIFSLNKKIKYSHDTYPLKQQRFFFKNRKGVYVVSFRRLLRTRLYSHKTIFARDYIRTIKR